MVGAFERRIPLTEVSYPVGLSFLLHGLLAMATFYAPVWFRGKPFTVPVTYEVTLVASSGAGGQPRASLVLPAEPKAATASAKTPASPAPAAPPRELLTLPLASRPIIPQTGVRPLPAPARTDEMVLSPRREAHDRRAPAPMVSPPAFSPKPAPPVIPPVESIVPPTVTPPPPLAVVKPAPLRGGAPPPPAPLAPTPTVIAPQVAAPPAISQPVIKLPVVTPSKVALGTGNKTPSSSTTFKSATAPQAMTTPATETQRQTDVGQGLGVGAGNTDPALAYYIVLVQEKIDSNWVPPKRSPGSVETAVLSVRVLRSGQVRDLAVHSSSGDRAFDDAALRAVRLSTPLPPLPPLYKAETIILELQFDFEGVKI